MPQLSTKYDNTRLGVIRLCYRSDNGEMLHVDITLENNIRQVNNTWWGSGKKWSGVMRYNSRLSRSILHTLRILPALWGCGQHFDVPYRN